MKARGLFLLLLAGCTGGSGKITPTDSTATTTAPARLNYSVGGVYRHDTTSYTEGLLFRDHQLFESSGATPEDVINRSIVGIVNMTTGKTDVKIELDKKVYFGEGICFFNDRLYQLTYKNHICFIYDAHTYKRIDSFRYQNEEGWALTRDSNSLIMSDGTSNLTYLDPSSLKPRKILAVTDNGIALDSLNELEYIKGYLYSNRYLKNYIFKIDTATGKVVGRIDLSSLAEQERATHPDRPDGAVLNGIAYDRDNDKIYVTGKLWSGIYQINFAH